METNTENFITPTPSSNLTGLLTGSGFLVGIATGMIVSLACLGIIVAGAFISSANLGEKCEARGSSLSDALRAQTFAPGVFQRPTWTESFSSAPDRITKTWLSSELSAVTYLEYLVYNCGYEESDIDSYYSDDNFENAIFNNYEDVRKVAECNRDSLYHFEFTGNFKNTTYLMYYWMQQEGSGRILNLMMAFPQSQKEELQQYASRVYSSLPSCD